jgi:hypothetical protein
MKSNKRTVKIPYVAHNPELSLGHTRLSYYEEPVRWGDLDQRSKWVSLPLWLADFINKLEKDAYWRGREAKLDEIQKMLGIRK